ncbi:phosphatidylethanolamine N-methyltransferase isoform X3 [Equus quagga]|uniref:phosphatidylethanolamine N-methyltransferase isoform X3 n=1 Tax=Equus quagga TaxID=89248 RepID=UPI001EE2106F|nr:phosphatidylethanolamine N-methyltransferase isoform X3 [Equus quagga]
MRPLRYDPAAGLRGHLGSPLCGCRPRHHFQPTLLECADSVEAAWNYVICLQTRGWLVTVQARRASLDFHPFQCSSCSTSQFLSLLPWHGACGRDWKKKRDMITEPQVARWEQKTRKLSRAFRSPYLACYSLGCAILLLNFLRSHCFTQAMLSQPKMESLDNPVAYCVGLALLGVGTVFVLSSFFALGFTGTFLGDYFGILKEARVTTFPFNLLDNPMYWGSTANYLGWAIMHASPAGLLLTMVVALIYVVAVLYEEPFTAEIYRQKASQSHKRS